MIIKKFQGKNEEEATEAARRELGNSVVIMNVRNIKRKGIAGFFKSPQVEVTVALEEEQERSTPKAATMTALEQLAARQKEINEQRARAVGPNAANSRPAEPKTDKSSTRHSFVAETPSDIELDEEDDIKGKASLSSVATANKKEALEEKLDSLETLIKKKFEPDTEITTTPKNDDEPGKPQNEQIKFTKLLYNMMIDNEVHEKYANAIIEEAEKTNKPNMPFDYMLTNIYQKMILKFGTPTVITPAERGPKIVYFVGPTGVGKTTTIAKIASKLCVEDRKRVALLTADTYRIAAAEQLRTYANILEVPFRIIYSPGEVEQALEEFHEYDYILVDTAGHSHHNEEQKNNTNLMIHAVDEMAECEVYLVLSATTKYRDLTSIADTYKEMSDYRIIFTKLDETTSFGNLLNLKLYTGFELSYVTYGQNVPDDIDRFNPQTTVKSILGGH
ncbi:MAG: flagellar biosynthesis protein FlhF [Lachnospiraceae bacterium]|nr:flagellar biosynthesis protein FlhF [Candidatus Colinaster scatohippi]